jgi:hypothetical protein
MNRFARAVSFLLGPTFTLFPIIFISVAKFSHDYSHALKWTIISYAFVLPVVLFVIAGVVLGYFSNFDVSRKEQRPLLFSFCAVVMLCYFLFIFIFNGPKILYIDLFAMILGLIVIIFVNKWIKASIHLATLTSAVLFIGIIYKGYTFLLLGLIPLLAWSRVKTKEHSVKETIIGTILGIVITLLVYLIIKQFFMWLVRN